MVCSNCLLSHFSCCRQEFEHIPVPLTCNSDELQRTRNQDGRNSAVLSVFWHHEGLFVSVSVTRAHTVLFVVEFVNDTTASQDLGQPIQLERTITPQ